MKHFERIFGADFLTGIPTSPGVYRILNEHKEIVYVGKAKNLRRRLSQYKNAKRVKAHRKMRKILQDANAIEWDLCTSDLDACLQETKLIQQLRPRWNIANAFAFLYPFIGMQVLPKQTNFVLTTLPEHFPEFIFFGAFRSRLITGDAFFSLMKLFAFIGHPVPWKKMNGGTRLKRSYLFGFRQIPPDWPASWDSFFRGQSDEALGQLFLRLLEKAAARKKASEVQGGMKHLQHFWKHEAQRLATAIRETGHSGYPVAQAERDPLFLRYRMRAGAT